MADIVSGKMSGNKGEWSELYAFMKLLSQGRMYAANEKVERIDDDGGMFIKLNLQVRFK